MQCLRYPNLQLAALRALALIATITPSDEYDEAAAKLGYEIMGGVAAMIPIDDGV